MSRPSKRAPLGMGWPPLVVPAPVVPPVDPAVDPPELGDAPGEETHPLVSRANAAKAEVGQLIEPHDSFRTWLGILPRNAQAAPGFPGPLGLGQLVPCR